MNAAETRGYVLVVEDDDDIRELVCELLSTETSCAIRAASNGQEAIDLLRGSERRPCLILLDWMMPIMDGQAVLEWLREDDVLAAIPVAVVSAAPDLEGKVGTRVLRKPVSLDSLVHLVRQHCGGLCDPSE